MASVGTDFKMLLLQSPIRTCALVLLCVICLIFAHVDMCRGGVRDKAMLVEDGDAHFNLPKTQVYMPPSLTSLLVFVTFSWNVHKLIYLEVLLSVVATYRTEYHVVIVTDVHASVLEAAMGDWNLPFRPDIWSAITSERDHKFWLLWEHKNAIEHYIHQIKHNATSVLYMEDDTKLSWPALLSWALDTEVLEPLNFTRCFVRTEIHASTGLPVVLDYKRTFSASEEKCCPVHISNHHWQGSQMCDWGRTSDVCNGPGVIAPCVVHKDYLSPPEPFQGMWIATTKQLAKYMQHRYWSKQTGSRAILPPGYDWGYPERTNSLNILMDIPDNCYSRCMVPFTPSKGGDEAPLLSAAAVVHHMRNGYSAKMDSKHGKIVFTSVVTP